MYFQHTPQIWADFPQLAASLLVVDNIHPNIQVEETVQAYFAQARQRLANKTEAQLAEVSAWRRAYSQMGLKPTKYRSAAEALLRRFRKEDNLPRLHPLVDICNAASLAYALPVAVFDLDQVSQFLEVRYAKGIESYLAFNGQIETPPENEVVFGDAEDHVHARRWTFRQSKQSTISPSTQRALIISEGLHETAQTDVVALIQSLTDVISQYWQKPSQHVALSQSNPRCEF